MTTPDPTPQLCINCRHYVQMPSGAQCSANVKKVMRLDLVTGKNEAAIEGNHRYCAPHRNQTLRASPSCPDYVEARTQ